MTRVSPSFWWAGSQAGSKFWEKVIRLSCAWTSETRQVATHRPAESKALAQKVCLFHVEKGSISSACANTHTNHQRPEESWNPG